MISTAMLAVTMTACSAVSADSTSSVRNTEQTQETAQNETSVNEETKTETVTEVTASDMFTERDLTQTADLSGAVTYDVTSGQNITISEEGVYVLRGEASNVTVTVDAADTAKVQIVLDGVSITNDSSPAVYVKSADKVFITTTDSTNTLKVTGTFTDDGNVSTDAVIFSKDDITINGTGTLNIESTDNGITSKDDLKITGSTISITCVSDALEAHDSVRVAGGTITVNTQKDGIHAENDEDNTTGFVYISGGTLKITAGDDAVHATTTLTLDGGTLDLSGREALEATQVIINDGKVSISASDDGINAGRKSTAYSVRVEINGGDITIVMGAGDTDAVDSNGDLLITGGTLNITAQSPFDYDGTASKTGGTVIVNGTETDTLSNQFMGGMGGQGMMPGGDMGNGQMPGGESGQGMMPGPGNGGMHGGGRH